MPSIQTFLSEVQKRNIARTEKYQVNIFGPGVNPSVEPDLTLFCEEVSIPGLNIGTRTVRLHNLNVQRPSTIDYMGESASFTFLMPGDWTIRKYFDAWMNKIVNRNREVNDYLNIIGRIEVNAIHEGTLGTSVPVQQEFEQHIRYGVVIEEAFPKGMNVIPMSYSNPGFVRLQMNFAFKYWTVKQGE